MFRKSIFDRVVLLFEEQHSDDRNTFLVLMTHTRQFFHSSLIPNYACGEQAFAHRHDVEQLLKLFTQSETLQFVPRLIFAEESVAKQSVIVKYISHLINETRYFVRSLQILSCIHMTPELLELVCKKVVSLESLTMKSATGVRDDDMKFLNEAPSLTELDVSFGWIDGTGFPCDSSPSPQQQKQSVNEPTKSAAASSSSKPVSTRRDLIPTRFAKQMRKLSMSHVFVLQSGNKALWSISKLTNLRSLDLSGCRAISSKHFCHLKALTSLQDLNLQGCENIGSLDPIRFMKKLRKLNLSGAIFAEDQQKKTGLACLRDLSELEELSLGKCMGELNLIGMLMEYPEEDGEEFQLVKDGYSFSGQCLFDIEDDEYWTENLSQDLHDFNDAEAQVKRVFSDESIDITPTPVARSLRSLHFCDVFRFDENRGNTILRVMRNTIGKNGRFEEFGIYSDGGFEQFRDVALFLFIYFTTSLRRISLTSRDRGNFYKGNFGDIWRATHLEEICLNTALLPNYLFFRDCYSRSPDATDENQAEWVENLKKKLKTGVKFETVNYDDGSL